MCKVSVVVPVYNAEKYFRACLDSLSTQTLDNIEVIIVNDGSTDESLAIANEFAIRFPWFKVYTTQNHGVSHARNYGISKSCGDYIAFVDSDDSVEPDYCRAMYEKAVRDGNDLVVCQFDRVTLSKGEVTHLVTSSPLFDANNFSMTDCRDLFGSISVGPWDKLVRKDLLAQLSFPEEIRYAEDQIFAVKAFCYAKNIGTVKQILYHYYYEIHGGVTSGFGEERLDWVKVMVHLSSFIRDDKYGYALKDEIAFFMLSKSMRLCAAAIVRTNLNYDLRMHLVRTIHAFFEKNLPDWQRNPYYIKDVIKRSHRAHSPQYNYSNGKRVRALYCNYSESHCLALIKLSHILPDVLFSIVLRVDQGLFSFLRKIRWGLFRTY